MGEGLATSYIACGRAPTPNQFQVNDAPHRLGHAGGMTDLKLPCREEGLKCGSLVVWPQRRRSYWTDDGQQKARPSHGGTGLLINRSPDQRYLPLNDTPMMRGSLNTAAI